NEIEDDAPGVSRVPGAQGRHAVRFQGGRRARHALLVRQGGEPAADRPLDWDFGGCDHRVPFGRRRPYTCNYKDHTPIWLQMQEHSIPDAATELERLIDEALPDRRGLGAWRALLRAHPSLMRELSTDLAMKT